MGTLYVVSTPIGNMEDITLRALRVLREVSLIAAEDTRHSGRLLKRYGIQAPLISYFEHNKLARQGTILGRLTGGDVALVSDAGTPGLSDPGFELIVAVIDAGWPVVAIPGPSALLTGLVVSGLPTDQFVYLGFLPRRSGERQRLLAGLCNETRTMVFYEAPHRLLKALEDVQRIMGDRRAVVCRELTKLHEEVLRLPVSEALEWFRTHEPRGEFTIVLAGEHISQPKEEPEFVEEQLVSCFRKGMTAKSAVQAVAEATGLSRRKVYEAYLRLKEDE